ncbi:MAG: NADH:flavin oxidoreductase / oxidase family [Chloroflexi bacterium]|nr:NADH:flavin oxidoreductase / oxidase family [Chloroflexota bacterium]
MVYNTASSTYTYLDLKYYTLKKRFVKWTWYAYSIFTNSVNIVQDELTNRYAAPIEFGGIDMMSQRFPYLFKPGKIGNVEVKNRIVMATMGATYWGIQGEVTDRPLIIGP